MATPGELIDCIAELTGIHRQSVMMADRALSAAGLRRKAGRGPRSAARMTGLDAARLLIAVLSGEQLKDSPAAVMRIGSLKSYGFDDPVWHDLPAECAQLRDLDPGSQFAESLATLIEIAPDLAASDRRFRITVEMRRPQLSAEIRIEDWDVTGCWPARFGSEEFDHLSRSDVRHQVEFSERTIYPLAELITGRPAPLPDFEPRAGDPRDPFALPEASAAETAE